MNENEIVLIDGNSYIHRAFHALRDLRNSKGQPTNAIYGFLRMLDKVLKEKKPKYAAVIFDTGKPTFRHEKFPDYKINRLKMPEDMVSQLPYIREIVQASGITILEKDGFEADDLIATICEWARKNGFKVTIVSSDKDLLQLLSENIIMWDTMKDVLMTPEHVIKKYELPPDKLEDIFALMGDASDNVPGVPGIGPKTAIKLIKEYGSLENVIKNADKIKSKKVRENLKKYADQALLSRELVRLKKNAPVEIDLDKLALHEPDYEKLAKLFRELEFKSFLEQLPVDIEIKNRRPKGEFNIVTGDEESNNLLDKLAKAKIIAIDVVADSPFPMIANLVGLCVATGAKEAYYIPFMNPGDKAPEQSRREKLLESLKPFLESDSTAKVGHNLKFSLLVLKRAGITLKAIDFDVMIASYLLDPGKNSHGLETIARELLDEDLLSFEDIAGKGKKQLNSRDIEVDKLCRFACLRSVVAWRVAPILREKLENENLIKLFSEIEMPLVNVLASMEEHGVLVDREKLEEVARNLERRLKIIEQTIYELAGEEFNIQSPKQLREILFDKLGLPVIKKTKTGPSTDVEVLTVLSREHPLPKAVLEYRSLAKLKSGYVDSLPKLINPETGRIHTSYNQTVTATGRLSSSDPNLQNIPIRTEEGREIRSAFVAPPGFMLLSADYSQIELRILAHYSGDELLIEAFQKGEDIHAKTASEVLGVPISEVTPDMRRQAKVVNFGIIYGMGAYGLAKELGISTSEAKEWIENYFKRYQGVKQFIDKTIATVREKGYVETLWGRKRYIPEINSRNKNVQQFGERLAVNTPIQGSAADLIKSVMIRLHGLLPAQNFKSTMILQVHDELIFEVEENACEELGNFLKQEMTAVKRLKVPLEVEIGWGKNWTDAHP